MITTIDGAGRIVIPKSIRQRLGLRGGQRVEVTERDGTIEIQPVATPMKLVKRKGRLVAVADRDLPPLTAAMVRETLEKVRR